MQAFVKYGPRPFEAKLCDLAMPEPGGNEVLLQVAGCGICGSDLHAYQAAPGYEWVTPPVTLGHEFAGTIIETGRSVRVFKAGDRVAVVGIQGCSHCSLCKSGEPNLCLDRKVIGLSRDGGMAEYAVVDATYLIPIPDAVDLSMCALVEPISVAAHALSKTVIRPGARVVVSGPGPIGLFCAKIAALNGAKVIILGAAVDEEIRLSLARSLGFKAVNVDREIVGDSLMDIFNGAAPDMWLEASGSPQALLSAIDLVRRGGCIVGLSMYSQSLEWLPTVAVRASLSMFFSYASVFRDYYYALYLLAEGLIEPTLFADFFPLAEAEEAFMKARAGKTVKPVLIP